MTHLKSAEEIFEPKKLSKRTDLWQLRIEMKEKPLPKAFIGLLEKQEISVKDTE